MKLMKPISLVVACAVLFTSLPSAAATAGIRHFYTASEPEFRSAVALGWTDEGIEGRAYEFISGEVRPPTPTIAILRPYNPQTGARELVTDSATAELRVSEGYNNEGRIGFAWPSDYNLIAPSSGGSFTDFEGIGRPKFTPFIPFDSVNKRWFAYANDPDDFIYTIKPKTDPINAPILGDYSFKGWIAWVPTQKTRNTREIHRLSTTTCFYADCQPAPPPKEEGGGFWSGFIVGAIIVGSAAACIFTPFCPGKGCTSEETHNCRFEGCPDHCVQAGCCSK